MAVLPEITLVSFSTEFVLSGSSIVPYRFLGVRQTLLRVLFLVGRHDFWEVHVKLTPERYS